MSIRVLSVQKPAPSPSPISADQPAKMEPGQGHTRRRRHTPHNHQDRLIRIFTRILLAMGLLMMLWLLLDALGWL